MLHLALGSLLALTARADIRSEAGQNCDIARDSLLLQTSQIATFKGAKLQRDHESSLQAPSHCDLDCVSTFIARGGCKLDVHNSSLSPCSVDDCEGEIFARCESLHSGAHRMDDSQYHTNRMEGPYWVSSGCEACVATLNPGGCAALFSGDGLTPTSPCTGVILSSRACAAAAAVHCGVLASEGCRTVEKGEPCWAHVRWAMQIGIVKRPAWYPVLTQESSFEQFQAFLSKSGHHECPMPCSPLPESLCHTVLTGEECHLHTTWAMEAGVDVFKAWYPAAVLREGAHFEEFQAWLHHIHHGDCPRPCLAAQGTETPTPAPTAAPIMTLTLVPTAAPTAPPTPAPSAPLTVAPTMAPTSARTASPTVAPTPAPTVPPTAASTPASTTMAPTPVPTTTPTAPPTPAPSAPPTVAPTMAPTSARTAPTEEVTPAPTAPQTVAQTAAPTASPTMTPTSAPTASPTEAPTQAPTSPVEVTPPGQETCTVCKSQCQTECNDGHEYVLYSECWGEPRFIKCQCRDRTIFSFDGCPCEAANCPS